MMRRRYAEVNDYNRNLLTLLKPFKPTVEQDVLGINPLNSTSKLEWQPH